MIVTMAVVTTMAMPPMLRWSLPRVPIGKSEKERLDREDIEVKGFVANLERLLLAVDDSPNGRFASRLAGLLAGPRGIPVTVLRQAESSKPGEEPGRESLDGPERHAVGCLSRRLHLAALLSGVLLPVDLFRRTVRPQGLAI